MRKSYREIATRHAAVSPRTIKKLRRLSTSLLCDMLKLRHPLEPVARTSDKELVLEKFAEQRWFPNDDEIKSK